ncbi:hypothetical protein POM88_010648 [Heracleum sosnowskyi]|uniref:1-deoxy-D-xylulose-5-phosphate synthase n=1 Tax=Heracleum sosnowskyi TaxID=360622 RepID=A0AAD8N0Q9_9APIA|nr:hypothetical protein POM88_010648 [Heracleum sosnowskyi]
MNSVILGMAVGRDLLGKNNTVIAIIGDGAMTAGQAYEAMNNAGYHKSNLIIVLNDKRQVSLPTATVDGPAPPVGALSKALTKLHSRLYYIGPVDGHNLEDLVYIFQKLKSMPEPGPVLIHIITEKGKRYPSVLFTLVFSKEVMTSSHVDFQKIPVRFAMDRAGLVGEDGPTHCGAFDTTFMSLSKKDPLEDLDLMFHIS